MPRLIPAIGLIGALLITAEIAMLFGGIRQYSSLAALAALPVASWEFSLGVWLIVKGFKRCPITAEIAARPGGLRQMPERQLAQTPALWCVRGR